VSTLDFDLLVSGDGMTLTRTDIASIGPYLEDLLGTVVTGRQQGIGVDEVQLV